MSLYRTWRPKSFADLVGQDAVVRTLTSAIEGGKLAHAYMFSGPRGSGKTSAAKILARCINCEHGPTAHPDNTCENCVAMLSGTALDVLEIDAASNRGIDEIRALRDAVKFAPSSMRMKVYIIDEAHMLTKEGANAFLKTLEEPPQHAVFILATTEPEKLPVTILSRCQRYAFRRISIPVMIERMREIATFEGITIDDTALAAIAYRADGGLRDALTMLEQAAAFAEGSITPQTIDLAFGASGRNYAQTLIDAVLARDAGETLRTIEEASDAGTDMQVLIRSLTTQFRNLLVARVNPELLQRDLAPEDAARAAERAKSIAQATIVRALRILSDASNLSRFGGNARLELETALLRFVLSSEDPTLEAISARVAALEETGSGAPSRPASSKDIASAAPPVAQSAPPTPVTLSAPKAQSKGEAPPPSVTLSAPKPQSKGEAPPPTSVTLSAPQAQSKGEDPKPIDIPPHAPTQEPEPTPPPVKEPEPTPEQPDRVDFSLSPPQAQAAGAGAISVQKVRAAWQNIRTRVEGERPPLRAPLSGAMVDSVDGNAVVLRLRDKFNADILKDHTGLVEKAIHDVLGHPLKVSIRIDASGGAAAPSRPSAASKAAEMPQQTEEPDEDLDALFNYANERIGPQ